MRALSSLFAVLLVSSLLAGCASTIMGWIMSGPSGHARLIDYDDKLKTRIDRAYALVRVGYSRDIKEPRRWAQFYSLDPETKMFIAGNCGPKEWFEAEVPEDESDRYFLFEVMPGTYAFVPSPGHIDGFDETAGAYFDLAPGKVSYLGDFINLKKNAISLEEELVVAQTFFQSHWRTDAKINKIEKTVGKIQDPLQILCY